MHPLHAAQAGAGDGAAVVAVPAADDDVALRLPFELPVAPHQPDHGIDGLAARAGEEHMLELRRRDLGQLRGQLDGRRRRALEEGVVVRQLVHLPRGDLGQLRAAIAHGHAPQARHAVQQLAALAVVQVDALGARDHARAARGDLLRIGERMQEMRGVLRLPVTELLVVLIAVLTRSAAGARAPRS